ncbi:HAD domain-containing protein [Kitasatospora camelliae]|uniref:HAD domain-containing protein n=1 Tax=Kitasatospora camelliae TaxID=3156397 RepID=A0AAU8JRS4_9ACTN
MITPAPLPLTPASLPLLFLDVDGPLIPFGAARGEAPRPRYPVTPAQQDERLNPLLERIDPAIGPRLAALPCALVWATTWMSDANDCVAPRLGLPRLPMVDFPEPSEEEVALTFRAGLHWKTRPLVDWAQGRPFAWVDDEITERDRTYVEASCGPQALLHRVDPATGLTEPDFTVLDHWLRSAA